MQTPAFLVAPRDSEARTVDPWAGVSGAKPGGFELETGPNPRETGPKPHQPASAQLGAELLDLARPTHDRLVIRCTPEFHAWAAGLADFWGVNLTTLVEQALRRSAESSGFDQLPPRRYRPSPRFRSASARATVYQERQAVRRVDGDQLDQFGTSPEPDQADRAIAADATDRPATLGL